MTTRLFVLVFNFFEDVDVVFISGGAPGEEHAEVVVEVGHFPDAAAVDSLGEERQRPRERRHEGELDVLEDDGPLVRCVDVPSRLELGLEEGQLELVDVTFGTDLLTSVSHRRSKNYVNDLKNLADEGAELSCGRASRRREDQAPAAVQRR